MTPESLYVRPGTVVIRDTAYSATVAGCGTVEVVSPVPSSSFSCSVRDLPYLLLVERQRSDELLAEVERLRKG
jgi:hypothetical protein